MFNVGTPELLVILLVALIVLGPDRLPTAARQVGRFMGEVRRMSSGFQTELRDALQEPVTSVTETLKSDPVPKATPAPKPAAPGAPAGTPDPASGEGVGDVPPRPPATAQAGEGTEGTEGAEAVPESAAVDPSSVPRAAAAADPPSERDGDHGEATTT